MLQVKVNLKDYPKFWEKLRVALQNPALRNAQSAEVFIEEEFGFRVEAHPNDKLGYVVMDESTFTWFELKWS